MDRRVSYDPLEATRDVHNLGGSRVVIAGLAQRLAFLHAVVEARRATLNWIGDQLREPVASSVIVAEHSRCVARCLAREHATECDDLRDRLATVLLGHVLDHALTAADREINIDIRHRHALGVKEALKEEVVADRVNVCNRECVGNYRTGRRATAWPYDDAVLACPANEVPDDQEVGVKAHPVDYGELHLDPLNRLGRRRLAVAVTEPLTNELGEISLLVLSFGQKTRDQLAPKFKLNVAAFGDLDSRSNRLGPLLERLRHLLVVAQVELVRLEDHPRVGER